MKGVHLRSRLTVHCACVSALCLLAMFQGCDSPDPGREARPPNVILILVDDMGWRDSAIYGSAFYETPHIDRLAREGMRFTDAYSASPLCSPTRAGLLTGLDPGRLRFTAPLGHVAEVILDPRVPDEGPPGERAVAAESRTRLPLEYRTIAEELRQGGYATAFFGKWHLGGGDYLPEHQGYDVAMPGGTYPAPTHYFSPYQMPGFRDGPKGEHIDERLAVEAARFMSEHRGRPFFICFWPFSVHFPFEADPALRRKYERKADPRYPQHNPNMGAMIETMDTSVGIVLKAVDDLGLREDTIILFLSDNGGVDWNFDPASDQPLPTDNAPLRGGKGQLYEGGVRVPLIVRWPGRVDAGSVSSEVVTSTDLYPTILELTGLEPAERRSLDGISILPALMKQPLSREAIFVHFPHYMPLDLNPPSTSARRGHWKLIRFYADTEDQQDRFELYDLQHDIGETRDVSKLRPDLVAELNALIDRHLIETAALIPHPNPAFVPERKAEARP